MVFQKKGRDGVVPGKLTRAIADIVSPRFCVGCEERLSLSERYICETCLKGIPLLDDTGLSEAALNHFPDGIIDKMIAISWFSETSPLRHLIHKLKYFDDFPVGKFLGHLLWKMQQARFERINIDLIIPVPLHKLRLVERGYNQSFEIASGLAADLNKKVENEVVERSRFTHQQVGSVNRHEREINMRKAFSVLRPLAVIGMDILIVDDVITTGSTIRGVATELMEAGAASVHAASILIA